MIFKNFIDGGTFIISGFSIVKMLRNSSEFFKILQFLQKSSKFHTVLHNPPHHVQGSEESVRLGAGPDGPSFSFIAFSNFKINFSTEFFLPSIMYKKSLYEIAPLSSRSTWNKSRIGLDCDTPFSLKNDFIKHQNQQKLKIY